MEHRELEIPPEVLDPSTPIATELETPMSCAADSAYEPMTGTGERVERPTPMWEVVASFTPTAGPDDGDLPVEPVEDKQGDEEDDQTLDPEPAPSDQHPCLCGLYEIVDPSTDQVVQVTGCGKTTKGRFAPGHDAKLKSLLIAAGVHGHRIRERGKDHGALFKPTTVANRFGFAPQVKKAIDTRRRTW